MLRRPARIGDHGGMWIFAAFRRPGTWCLPVCLASTALFGQMPMELVPTAYVPAVQTVIRKADFTFETTTQPAQARIETMEKLFDHPRLAAAMWRYCRFSPTFYAFECAGRTS